MARTLLQVRTRVRDNIEESTAGYWSDAEIDRRIISAYERLWNKIMQLRKTFFYTKGSVSTVQDVATVTLPADFYRAKSFRITTAGQESTTFRFEDSSSLEFINLQRADNQVPSPSEFLFDILGQNTLTLAPIPRSVLTIQVDYFALPTAPSSDSDTFGVIDPFLTWVEHAATSMALAKGPVGAYKFWENLASSEWIDILLTVDTMKQDQGPDLVESMFKGN